MQYSSRKHKIVLIIESVGFLLTIVLIWINERFDLPHLLFNSQETPYNTIEVLMEVSIIGILGVSVLIITHNVFVRIKYLGGFYRICAACKKVMIEDTWISIEEFLHKYAEIDLTHGLCEKCVKKYIDDANLN